MNAKSKGWIRVSKKAPCMACHGTDWCTVSGDGLVYKCCRVESKRPIKNSDGQPAWLHTAKDVGTYDLKRAGKPVAELPRLKVSEVKALLKEFKLNLTSGRLSAASRELCIPEASLKAFGIGYSNNGTGAYTFPMYDGEGKPCGVRLRASNGKKLCVPGSRNGLFIPIGYEPSPIVDGVCNDPYPLLLLLPEGPTDAAAAHALGFTAIGRPSNAGGSAQLAQRLASWSVRHDVVIVADHDEAKPRPDGTVWWPGIEGALDVCSKILAHCGKLRFVMPPDDAKDIRDWAKTGSHAKLLAQIIASKPINEKWLSLARAKVEKNRREWKPSRQIAAQAAA